MSNLGQFYGKGFPIGGAVSATYQGDVWTAPDGSVWLANTPTAPFAYTSDYASCAGIVTSPHPLMPGPDGGLWSAALAIAYRASTPLYMAILNGSRGDTTNGYFYYTSTDGINWTERTFPNAKGYNICVYTAGKFIAYSGSGTTNAVITSTDAVTWTSATGVALAPQDIVSDGANNIVAFGTSGTTAVSSVDGGTTWVSTTVVAVPNSIMPGAGVATWNAGAGLFITPTATAGWYQTSPTGATWTTRATQVTYSKYSDFFTSNTVSPRMASNATTTVAVGRSGFFCTTTDGLTWANHGYVSTSLGSNVSPNQVYHDGTRFVARYYQRVFYSTNGTTWIEGAKIGGGSAGQPQSNGKLFLTSFNSSGTASKMLQVSDVTLTTPQTVISGVVGVEFTPVVTYYRIK